jgi:hypothetical protein
MYGRGARLAPCALDLGFSVERLVTLATTRSGGGGRAAAPGADGGDAQRCQPARPLRGAGSGQQCLHAADMAELVPELHLPSAHLLRLTPPPARQPQSCGALRVRARVLLRQQF